MPEYLSPGVYVEEIDAGPKPIQGVGTSTTGFVGVTVRGPTDGKPELVTSFADYQRKFGGFIADPGTSMVNKWALDTTEGGRWWYFPLAVRGFFDNGGQRLFVKRVIADTAIASSADLGHGLVADLLQDVAAGGTSLKLAHTFGVDTQGTTKLRIFDADGNEVVNPLDPAGFPVASYDSEAGTVELTNPLPAALKAGSYFVQRFAVDSTKKTLTFTAKAKGKWGDDLSVKVTPIAGATLNMLADPAAGDQQATTVAGDHTKGDTTVEVAEVAGAFAIGVTVPFTVRIAGNDYAVSTVGAGSAPGQVTLTIAAPGLAADVADGTGVLKLRKANLAATDKLLLAGAGTRVYPGAIVELDDGKKKETAIVLATVGEEVQFGAALTNAGYLEGHKARVLEAEVSVRYAPADGPAVDETFTGLRLKKDDSNSSLIKAVNLASQLVTVTEGADYSESVPAEFPTAALRNYQAFGGGDDKTADLSVDDFVGADPPSGKRTGIQALEDIDEVAICAVPGMWSQTVQGALIQHCEILKDRFAILDPRDGLSIEGIRSFRAPIDTKYAALYYPWIEVRDPSVGRNAIVPPSGHMAGIYARVDVERGVHKAPANVVMRGITRFAQDITKRQQDLLNPQGINAFRFFPGRGNRVWGARTVSSDTTWKYINVRRLFIFVEESIDEGTQWVVFEPNSEDLWARVRASVTNFLTTVWREGALEGTTPEEAFFVVCDRTTMTQDDIDNGRLICVIGIAPVKPAEFVIFRIQQKTRDATP